MEGQRTEAKAGSGRHRRGLEAELPPGQTEQTRLSFKSCRYHHARVEVWNLVGLPSWRAVLAREGLPWYVRNRCVCVPLGKEIATLGASTMWSVREQQRVPGLVVEVDHGINMPTQHRALQSRS